MRVRVLIAGIVLACAALSPAALAAGRLRAPSAACLNAEYRQMRERPTHLRSAPPAALTSVLGVLRRPQTASDLPRRLAGPFLAAVWTSGVRLVGTASDGTRYYAIPGVWKLKAPPPCRRSDAPALLRRLSERSSQLSQGGVGLDSVGPSGDEEPVPQTAAEVAEGGAIFVLPSADSPSSLAYGLVPDGVASVDITGPAGQPISATVTNNFFVTTVAGGFPSPSFPVSASFAVRLLAADGSVIRAYTLTVATSTDGETTTISAP